MSATVNSERYDAGGRLGPSLAEGGVETLSIVVVNWNAGAALGECLTAVFGAKPTGTALEVFVVDNASSDRSQTLALREHPGVLLIQNRENLGFARAVNQGLRRATGELTLILNPDVVVMPGAIVDLAEFMMGRPDVAVAGPRLLNPDGSIQGSARRDPSPWTGLFGRSSLLTRCFPNNPVSRRELPGLSQPEDEPLQVHWVSGACLMVRRAAYESVGLLDERFFLFWEDADWGRRFRQAGWKVYYLPTACATHRVGVSRAHRAVRSEIDFHRSAYRFYRKHHVVSPLQPMMLPLTVGLLLSLGMRLIRTMWARQ